MQQQHACKEKQQYRYHCRSCRQAYHNRNLLYLLIAKFSPNEAHIRRQNYSEFTTLLFSSLFLIKRQREAFFKHQRVGEISRRNYHWRAYVEKVREKQGLASQQKTLVIMDVITGR